MNLFNNVLQHNETLFKNEIVLDYEYLPHILKFRESQQQHIATIIKPLFANRMGSNILITGKPGIGKTAACRHVLRDMEQHSDKIVSIYINCWKQDTAYKVLVDICMQLGYKWVQNKKTNELMDEIAKILNKKAAVIVLDEVDKLKEEQVIYQLVEDLYKKCIIMISNSKDFLAFLDQRTRSRLLPEILEFEPYTYKETEAILQERKETGFYDNVWSDEEFMPIVEKTADGKDLRIGLFLLRESGNAAENRASRKIQKRDVDIAVGKLSSFLKSSKVLDEEEQEVLEIVKEHQGLPSTEIYELYKELFDKSERTFRRKVASLKENHYLEARDSKDKNGTIVPHLFVK
ncbi:MAG TPA: AAA family ATPase [Candidatus Nanoarchaeia archaeon]|nr:AAA family ATPase [Candidatus Nanoarchaeia archaeon]